jgi:TfoX/Sxy family transcriptional regulator of competence genes
LAYSEALAARIREVLAAIAGVEDRRMFGGVCFTLHGNMLVGVVGEDLMARVGELAYEQALSRPGARPMDFTGRPMRGYVFVGPEGISSADDLLAWIRMARQYVTTLPPKVAKGAAAKAARKTATKRPR